MDTKITDFRTLMLLIDLDPKEHIVKEMARLLVGAVRDWPTDARDFVRSTKEFKEIFGNPLTIEAIRNACLLCGDQHWAWRLEAGWQLQEILKMSVGYDNTADFDVIVGNILTWYKKIYSTVDFTAEVIYFDLEHGKLQTPLKSGFQTHLKYEGLEKVMAVTQTLLNAEMVLPGEDATVKMKLLSPELFVDALDVDMPFLCVEGDSVIGTGKIKQVVNQRLETKSRRPHELNMEQVLGK